MRRFHDQYKKHAIKDDLTNDSLPIQALRGDGKARERHRSAHIIHRLLRLCLTLNVVLGITRIVRLIYNLISANAVSEARPLLDIAALNQASTPSSTTSIDIDLYLVWITPILSLLTILMASRNTRCSKGTSASRSCLRAWRWCCCGGCCFGWSTHSSSSDRELLQVELPLEGLDHHQQPQHQHHQYRTLSSLDAYGSPWPKPKTTDDSPRSLPKKPGKGSKMMPDINEQQSHLSRSRSSLIGNKDPDEDTIHIRDLFREGEISQEDVDDTYSFVSLNVPPPCRRPPRAPLSSSSSSVGASLSRDTLVYKFSSERTSMESDCIRHLYLDNASGAPSVKKTVRGRAVTAPSPTRTRSGVYDSSWLPAKPIHAQIPKHALNQRQAFSSRQQQQQQQQQEDRHSDSRHTHMYPFLINRRSTLDLNRRNFPIARSPLESLLPPLHSICDGQEMRSHDNTLQASCALREPEKAQTRTRLASSTTRATSFSQPDTMGQSGSRYDSDNRSLQARCSMSSESVLTPSVTSQPPCWSFRCTEDLEMKDTDCSPLTEVSPSREGCFYLVSELPHSGELPPISDMSNECSSNSESSDDTERPQSPRFLAQRISLIRYSNASSFSRGKYRENNSEVQEEDEYDESDTEDEEEDQMTAHQFLETEPSCSAQPVMDTHLGFSFKGFNATFRCGERYVSKQIILSVEHPYDINASSSSTVALEYGELAIASAAVIAAVTINASTAPTSLASVVSVVSSIHSVVVAVLFSATATRNCDDSGR
ncbi:hypothetical protein BGW42_008712 [Actinomortierella wolfii]|nr:hypothetical protein BGW42_008712 [Actinomortierella wolfii]